MQRTKCQIQKSKLIKYYDELNKKIKKCLNAYICSFLFTAVINLFNFNLFVHIREVSIETFIVIYNAGILEEKI